MKNGGNSKVAHGLFKRATGLIINNDVNEVYNIHRKTLLKAKYGRDRGSGCSR